MTLAGGTVVSIAQSTDTPEIRAIIAAASEASERNPYPLTNAIDKVIPAFSDANLAFIKDLWEGNSQKHPSIPWERFRLEIVRVELANVLLQAHRNGFKTVEKSQLHQFVRERTVIFGVSVKTPAGC
jgi:hypothetical protein